MTTLLQTLLDGLSVGATYALLALGLTIPFSVLRLVNFAYGDMVVWIAYGLVGLAAVGTPWWALIIAAPIIGAIQALLLSELVFTRLPSSVLTLLLSSFGLSLCLQALATLFFSEQPKVFPRADFLAWGVEISGVYLSAQAVINTIFALLVVVVLSWSMRHTDFGIAIRASTESPEVARLMGISRTSVVRLAMAISGAIAGVVAVLWFANVGTISPRAGFNLTLIAFIVLVLGGLGSSSGAIIGGLIFGMAQVILANTLPSDWVPYQEGLIFALVIAVLVFRPGGVGGRLVEQSK